MTLNPSHNSPLVSILIPVRNGGDYLLTAISSAINQTYPNLQVVISNNHSTDSSEETIERFNDKRILVIKPPNPCSMTENWNYALSHSTGKYAIVLGADDILHEDFINERVVYHESNPQVFLSSSPHNVINESGAVVSVFDSNLRGLLSYEDLFPILLRENPLNILTVFFKLEIKNSGVITNFPSHDYFPDWALWLEMIAKHSYVFFFDSVRCDYRIHTSSISSSFTQAKWALEHIKLVSNFLNSHDLQLAKLKIQPDITLQNITDNFWLAAQCAFRNGELRIAWQLWNYYRRSNNLFNFVRSLRSWLSNRSNKHLSKIAG